MTIQSYSFSALEVLVFVFFSHAWTCWKLICIYLWLEQLLTYGIELVSKELNHFGGIALFFQDWASGTMTIRVVEFSNRGYKIRKIFAWESTYSKEIIAFLELHYWGGVKKCKITQPLDFQSQFSTSKIIWIFVNFFFIEEYQFRSTFFVIDIFW